MRPGRCGLCPDGHSQRGVQTQGCGSAWARGPQLISERTVVEAAGEGRGAALQSAGLEAERGH